MKLLPALLALALAAPALAQEAPPEPEPQSTRPRLAAAMWCPVTDGPDEDRPPCDAGLGLALHCWGRLCPVAVLGRESLGAGLAWVAWRPETGPSVAVALGAVVRYDELGIDGSEVYPALGATVGFGRGE